MKKKEEEEKRKTAAKFRKRNRPNCWYIERMEDFHLEFSYCMCRKILWNLLICI